MRYFLILIMAVTFQQLSAQTTQQADSLHQRGRELANEGKIAEGRECTRQAMEIRKKLLGEVSEDYITSLNNYALTFSMEKDYQKAIELQEQVMTLCGRLKQPHTNIGLFTTNMGRFYYLGGDMKKAVKLWEQAIPLVEKHGEVYEFLLNGLALVYDELGDQEGANHIMALTEEHNQYELAKPCDEPKCMLERAQYYGAKGDQPMAKECYLKVLAMPMADEMKERVYESYGTYLGTKTNDYAAGADYLLMAANIAKIHSGETESYANTLYKAGLFAYIGQKYGQSIEAYENVVNFYSNSDSPAAKKNIALCMKGMGNSYHGLKTYGKSAECYRKLLEYYEQNDQESEEYPKAIIRLAKAEKYNKDYAVSIEHHKKAMAVFEQRGMTSDYADAASSLQMCYVYAGIKETVDDKHDETKAARMERIDRIIKQELEGLEMARNFLGKLTYACTLSTLAGCYEMKEDYENSIGYYQQYMMIIREAIRDEFRLQSEKERMTVWNTEKKSISLMLELLTSLPQGKEKLKADLAGTAYDAELLSKGILLNSAIEFEKVLAAHGDSRLKTIYEQSKTNEAEIERLRQSATKDEDLDKILQLTQQNQALQLELYRGCAEFADYTNYISYTWKDVQEAMLPSDVAVEFAVVGHSVFSRENHLIALVLTKGMDSPAVVPVCKMDELNKMEADENLYEDSEAGNAFWGTLSNYLVDKQRVFFSADGALNRIGIEYLQYHGMPFSEQFEAYRLSSTKELCFRHGQVNYDMAVLFGDINYNDEATTSKDTQRGLASLRGSGDSGVFADLGNTLREVNDIQAVLTGKGVKEVLKLRDTEASRDAFTGLTDSKVNLLHIATHGMYKSEKQLTDAESMQNSFLAFAGANLEDKALVTAADIAKMNLRNCDMAVLSACETGLGKLGGDGVFGLQRGFKNAGVHTLLMSLKNVYDESTADLMISFYRHLMDGSSKREALVKAQQDIRSKGYKDPKYWATFILLDAF